jgi:hypothetical protein
MKAIPSRFCASLTAELLVRAQRRTKSSMLSVICPTPCGGKADVLRQARSPLDVLRASEAPRWSTESVVMTVVGCSFRCWYGWR